MEQYPKIYLYKRLVQAKLFIDAHYAEPIDLDLIADEACFSKFHFIRLFKAAYGRTPNHYLQQVRIQEAQRLLQAGRPAAEVCCSVGFDSVSSFSGLFKKLTGSTPAAYGQQQRHRKEAMHIRPLHFVPGCFAHRHGWTEKQF